MWICVIETAISYINTTYHNLTIDLVFIRGKVLTLTGER